jgi:hypothetical protein
MQGTLPPEWGDSGSFPVLKKLGVNGNRRLEGSLPAAWGAQPKSFDNLQLIVAKECNMSGTLPAAWASTLPALEGLDVSDNNISGKRCLFLLFFIYPSPSL